MSQSKGDILMRPSHNMTSVRLRRTSQGPLWIKVLGQSAQAYHETVRSLVDDDGIERVDREWLASVQRVSHDLRDVTD